MPSLKKMNVLGYRAGVTYVCEVTENGITADIYDEVKVAYKATQLPPVIWEKLVCFMPLDFIAAKTSLPVDVLIEHYNLARVSDEHKRAFIGSYVCGMASRYDAIRKLLRRPANAC